MGKKLILGLIIGAFAISYGCSKDSAGTTAKSLADYDFPVGSTDVATGTAVYAEFCEGCHPGAGADEGDGPKLSGKDISPAQLRWKVRSGGDDMPAFGADKISDADLETLLAYAITLDIVSP